MRTNNAAGIARPYWDRLNLCWYVDGQLVKKYAKAAPNQFAVLDAFESIEWEPGKGVPVPSTGRATIRQTLQELQGHAKQRIKFHCIDGKMFCEWGNRGK
jgi:hypothetical protein